MSKASRQRLREAKQRAPKRKFRWLLPLIVLAVFIACAFAWIHFHPQMQESAGIAKHPPMFKPPGNLKELLALSPDQLDQCDIGLMNLLCAEGLPGAENLEVPATLKKLDGMAEYVKAETQRAAYRFNEHPEQFRHSLGYYRMMTLGTILVQDLGIRYNPQLALPVMDGQTPTLGQNANASDVFIHGLFEGNHYGTCASMPVLVVAIGRRLGYPVNLAGAKYHLYVRYEEPNGTHFNIEPTVTEVFLTPEDEEYKNGQFKTTGEEIKGYSWLRPLSHQEILSDFLHTRAICLGDAKRYDEAKQTFLLAASFWQATPQREKSLNYYLNLVSNAPAGDQWDALWDEVDKLAVPQGTRSAYFDNRKEQVHYFMNDNPDVTQIALAVDGLKNELAEYRRQIERNDPALAQYRQHIFRINLKSGVAVRLPAEILPPPLNRGQVAETQTDDLREMVQVPQHIVQLNLTDPQAVVEEIWRFHKEQRIGWMKQASLLPSW